MNEIPYIISFQSIGSPDQGYISVADYKNKIPFAINRIFWTYYTPQSITRGRHANIDNELVLISVAGSIEVKTETINGNKQVFSLDKPDIGLYLPKLCWHVMQYSHSAVQLAIASNFYSEADYIRDYNDFLSYVR